MTVFFPLLGVSVVLVESGMPGQPVPAHCPAWQIPCRPLREAGKPEVLSDVLTALYFTSGCSSHLQNGVMWVTLRSELILGFFPVLDEGLKPPQPVLMLEVIRQHSCSFLLWGKGWEMGKGGKCLVPVRREMSSWDAALLKTPVKLF